MNSSLPVSKCQRETGAGGWGSLISAGLVVCCSPCGELAAPGEGREPASASRETLEGAGDGAVLHSSPAS